ncbi:exported hypothetical protein [Nitrosomonas mobilis]|uniref:Uncharacterized protein n=1 Tax=Nitrosomonas mobilis TaxID=51642 RepID=A0A1G5SES0_9PROT|nr:exported hypothetical protein [Nitrosomonas mobilis]
MRKKWRHLRSYKMTIVVAIVLIAAAAFIAYLAFDAIRKS